VPRAHLGGVGGGVEGASGKISEGGGALYACLGSQDVGDTGVDGPERVKDGTESRDIVDAPVDVKLEPENRDAVDGVSIDASSDSDS